MQVDPNSTLTSGTFVRGDIFTTILPLPMNQLKSVVVSNCRKNVDLVLVNCLRDACPRITDLARYTDMT